MSMINLYDGPHVDIVGATGSGKSTVANSLYKHAPATAIYIDPSAEEEVQGTTIDYRDGETFDAQVLGESRRIRIIPPHGTGTEEDMEMMAELQAVLFQLGGSISHQDGRFYVFIDEAHEFTPLHAEGTNPVVRMAKRGRKRNIRLFLVSQSPADMSKKAVKQMNYHMVFALNDYSIDYLKRYGMPADAVKRATGHKDEHKFVIWDGFDLTGPYRLDEKHVE